MKIHGRRHGPAGSDPIPGIPSFGQINGSSTDPFDPGSGDWTVDTDFDGIWTITFLRPFNGPPTVVVCENETTTLPPSFIQVWSASADTVVVYTYDITGTLSDDIGFNFVAVGPA